MPDQQRSLNACLSSPHKSSIHNFTLLFRSILEQFNVSIGESIAANNVKCHVCHVMRCFAKCGRAMSVDMETEFSVCDVNCSLFAPHDEHGAGEVWRLTESGNHLQSVVVFQSGEQKSGDNRGHTRSKILMHIGKLIRVFLSYHSI